MTTKIPKFAYRILVVILAVTFTVAACNNKSDKKETTVDTTVKPMDNMPTDTSKMDTASTRPVKTPD